MINEANESSSACHFQSHLQVETSAPPVEASQINAAKTESPSTSLTSPIVAEEGGLVKVGAGGAEARDATAKMMPLRAAGTGQRVFT